MIIFCLLEREVCEKIFYYNYAFYNALEYDMTCIILSSQCLTLSMDFGEWQVASLKEWMEI